MIEKNRLLKKSLFFGLVFIGSIFCLLNPSKTNTIEAMKSVATHIGTFEGSTTFTTSSSNGVHPGLFIEVMDEDGNLTQYESEEGMITIPETKEGAYVTQAKLLGKTKYVDEDTGEILDQFEAGRNLKLISVENPILTTTGRNLWNGEFERKYPDNHGNFVDSVDNACTELIKIKPNTYYSAVPYGYNTTDDTKPAVTYTWYIDGVYLSRSTSSTFSQLSPSNATHMRVHRNRYSGVADSEIKFMIVEGNIKQSSIIYEPYQSNVLTISEEMVLHGIDNVRDELDLITGEVTRQIKELVLDGSEHWNKTGDSLQPTHPDFVNFFYANPTVKVYGAMKANSLPIREPGIPSPNISWFSIGTHSTENHLRLCIERTKASTVAELKTWLSNHPIQAQYQLAKSVSENVKVASTYFFKPINKESIQVTGTVTPLVGSVTVPTNPLSFVLNPNGEVGQQFIAPEFSIRNETNAPIQLILNRFEQTMNVLNDVLPDKYSRWEGLNKQESKDIALALVPKVSEGWVSLIEGPRYVAGTSNDELGVVKPKSTVDFTFLAHHGQAFDEVLNPNYRLAFVFGFSQ